MRFGKSEWSSWDRGIEREWLLTNGIGGFSSSTIIGGNSRRYHGLLVASLDPPAKRHLILSQLHENVIVNGNEYDMHSFSTGCYINKGYYYQQSFEMDPLPVFIYSFGDVFIEKTVSLVYGENTVVVQYRLKTGAEAVTMKITPLVNFRDHHGDSSKNHMSFNQIAGCDHTNIKPYDLGYDILIGCHGSTYEAAENCWFEGMFYAVEQERGLHGYEDHYIPGTFTISTGRASDTSFYFVCTLADNKNDSTVTDIPGTDVYSRYLNQLYGQTAINAEKDRIRNLTAGCCDDFCSVLTRSADHFIVYRRSTGAKTIIAGYPWFTDWGRDAMISLSGLTLATGRYEDARMILSTFSQYIQHGLVPNMFPDDGSEPCYNTVDAALWYFEAINNYVEKTGDIGLVKDKLYSSMLQIYKRYRDGTLNDIRMDGDCLITAGSEDTQLTWMDAKAGNTVFTPRQGKAVEINALWYNALKVMEQISGRLGFDQEEYRMLAVEVRKSFIKVFWNDSGKYLFDVVNGEYIDDSVRPNQIFAVSLAYPVIDGSMARCVVEKVWKELYTAYGIRSLSPQSDEYRGRYLGGQYERDSAYHQGTVWAWLTGHFITAFSRTFASEPVYADMPKIFLKPFMDHLYHACLGSISEIFDGEEPLTPRGCFAQAWSVAEILRAYVENVKCGQV